MPTRDHGTFARPTLAAVSDRAVPQARRTDARPQPQAGPVTGRPRRGVPAAARPTALSRRGLHQTPSELGA